MKTKEVGQVRENIGYNVGCNIGCNDWMQWLDAAFSPFFPLFSLFCPLFVPFLSFLCVSSNSHFPSLFTRISIFFFSTIFLFSSFSFLKIPACTFAVFLLVSKIPSHLHFSFPLKLLFFLSLLFLLLSLFLHLLALCLLLLLPLLLLLLLLHHFPGLLFLRNDWTFSFQF